ncbi:hypothetical protein E4U44_008684 [Claviceps purpurea]|nr:hypothetical protein E4U44_008684 [Claviceps purpurea]
MPCLSAKLQHLLYTANNVLTAVAPPSPPSPSPWQTEVITIEDDAAPADPITIDDGTESDCNQQQKEANLEDIEKMKVEEDDSDSEDEGSLSQPALPQEQTFALLGALDPSTRADVRLARGAGVLSTRLRRAAWFRLHSVKVVWQEERGIWQDV